MRSANERRRYDVTSSLIGWAHSQNEHGIPQVYRYNFVSLLDKTKQGEMFPMTPNSVLYLPSLIFFSFPPEFNTLHKDNCKTRRWTVKFWDLVRLVLEIWWYVSRPGRWCVIRRVAICLMYRYNRVIRRSRSYCYRSTFTMISVHNRSSGNKYNSHTCITAQNRSMGTGNLKSLYCIMYMVYNCIPN